MKEAGCVGSNSERIQDPRECLRITRNHSPGRHHSLLRTLLNPADQSLPLYSLRGPGEDEGTIEESFRLMDQLDPTAVIAMLGIRIYPGTELGENLRVPRGHSSGFKAHISLFLRFAKIGERLSEIIQEKALARKRWIVPGLEINITRNLLEQIRKFRIRGPLWNWWEG